MTITAPPPDIAGAALDTDIATVQALITGGLVSFTADSTLITADELLTVDYFVAARNDFFQYSYQQLLNHLQVEAVDHYMVTGWCSADRILQTFAPPTDPITQTLAARVADLAALVANAPAALPGNAAGYGSAGWTTVLQNYQQQLYAAQISLVERMMDVAAPTAASILATMTGVQSFPFEYSSQSPVPSAVNPGGNFPIAGLNNGIGYPPSGNPLPTIVPPASTVLVPYKVGVDQAQAATELAQVGLVLAVDGSQFDAVNPAGSISTQFPAAGNLVPTGSSVIVKLSLGPSRAYYFVGGVLTGLLSDSVQLQNNGGDTITLSANGPFTFPAAVADGATFNVTVLTQPVGQTVALSHASGTISGVNVSSVQAVSSANLYTIGGTLSGYTSGTIVLQNNGGDNISLTASGPYTFPTPLPNGAAYAVTVFSKPVGHNTTLSNATGVVAAANVTNANAADSVNSYTVGGHVSGLTGTLVLQNNGGDNLTLNADGAFTFATPVANGGAYAVTVLTQPAGQTCVITNGSGTIAGANITNVVGTVTPPTTYSVGGTLSGLIDGSVQLQNNGGDTITVSANGSFTFPTKLVDTAAYAVTVLTQPAGQTVSLSNATGNIAAANVTNVGASSAANTYTIGGTLSGLIDGSVTLRNNGGDDLVVSANGAFVFVTPVAHGSPYAVTVLTQPSGQTVALSNASGTVGAANVTSVGATSTANTYSIGGTLSGLIDGSVVLQNNGGNNLTLSANGPFTFTTKVPHAGAYAVTVLTQPAGQSVTLSSASGTVAAANITSVAAASAPLSYTVGGTLSGLAAGQSVVLQLNGTGNGNYDPTFVPAPSNYYYVDLNAGVDGTGLSAASPHNVLPGSITSGMQLLFNSDNGIQSINEIENVFSLGTVSNVQIGSYGSGKAVISGYKRFVNDASWSNVSGNVWKRTYAGALDGSGRHIIANVMNMSDTTGSPQGTLLNWVDASAGGFSFSTIAANTYAYDLTNGIMYINLNGADPRTKTIGISSVSRFLTVSGGASPSKITFHHLRCIGFGRSVANFVRGSNQIRVHHNELYGNGYMYVDTVYEGSGFEVSHTANNIEFDNNLIEQTGDSAISPQHFGGSTGGHIDNIHIHHNTIYTWALAGVEVSNFGDNTNRTTNLLIEYNRIVGGGTGFSGRGHAASQNICAGVHFRGNNGNYAGITIQHNTAQSFDDAIAMYGGTSSDAFVITDNRLSSSAKPIDNSVPTTIPMTVTNNYFCANTSNAITPASPGTGSTYSGNTTQAGECYVTPRATEGVQTSSVAQLSLSTNGAFTFGMPLNHGSAYTVSVFAQPSGQTCTLSNATGTVGSANVTNVGAVCATPPPPVRRYTPGIYVAVSYADCGQGPNGDTLSSDTGTFSYAAGTTAAPLTITGNYSSGTLPGGKTGTGTTTGCSKGTGAGGHTMVRNTSGPFPNFNATHRAMGVVTRYPWRDIEPTQGNYVFTRMDADLAQCIALGIQWFPMPVFHTFGNAEAPTGANGNPIPDYLAAYTFAGSGGQAVERWNLANVSPSIVALLTAIGRRYDLCANFGGVATQETSTSGGDTAAHHFSTATYLTCLRAESDALANASPNSRHLAYQNFGGSKVAAGDPAPDLMIDQYAAYIQKNGAILCGPDLVTGGGSVYNSCYTSGSGVQAGRYSGYHFGGTIGSGVNFSSTGPTALAIQRAEWIGIAPAKLAANGGQSVQQALNYGRGSTSTSDGVQPNFLNIDIIVLDWHQGAGAPNNQQFTPDGINLIQNNAATYAGNWTP